MEQLNGYSQISSFDDTQAFNVAEQYQYSGAYATTVNLRATPSSNRNNNNNNNNTNFVNKIENWEQLLGENPGNDNVFPELSQAETLGNLNTSFGFQQQQQQQQQQGDPFQYNQEPFVDRATPEEDYESIIRSKNLYYDPEPQIIRKPSMPNPVVYNQNIMIRFLQPPPVSQGPLIVREIRPPQPPPPPPLVIRQHPPPPLSPPPIILRERPPLIPSSMTAKVITKTLPPIPPPPRSVIIENLPRLPAKPRDVIIERWIPYESMYKRQVVVHRAKESKPYPAPKNIIITYEPVQSRIVRQFQRLGVTPEDPASYSRSYGNTLLETEQLLAQIRELGINVDLSPPPAFNNEQQPSVEHKEHSYDTHTPPHQQTYGEVNNNNTNNNNNTYIPTYENLVNGSVLPPNYDGQQVGQDNKFFSHNGEDLSTQLGHYGVPTEAIPY